ncbi:MAG: LamG domain-containing protein [Candidatus Taylorbacteria bacterium]|nr:LamG domain-containing protein [Candidatus Taylorbacteria bacterium]
MNKRAFTLIELLVVVSIISLLSSVVLSSLNSARDKARIAAGKQFAAQAGRAAGDYAMGIWELDECSGSSAGNRAGTNLGTIVGGASWTADSIKATGCSLSFDGSTGYVWTTNPTDQTQSYSYSFWIKPDAIANAGLVSNSPINPPISGGNGNSNNIYLNSNGTVGYFIFNGSGQNITSTTALGTGKWYHIAVSHDAANGKRSLYVNGRLEGQDTNISTQSFGRIIFSFNRNETGYFPGPNVFFDGQMDEIHFFAKALVAEEVGVLYAVGASRREMSVR